MTTLTQDQIQTLAEGEHYRDLVADINRLIDTAWSTASSSYAHGTAPRLIRRHTDQVHAALLSRLIDLMRTNQVDYWQRGDIHVYRYWPPISEGDEIVAEYHGARDECAPVYPPREATWVDNWYGVFDADLYQHQVDHWTYAEIAAATGEDAGHCWTCDGPAFYEEWYDLDRCPHCEAPAMECEAGCYDVGLPGYCIHHGLEAWPIEGVE